MPKGDVVITDAKALRALAHPARLAILDFLGRHGPATATECSEAAGLSPAACSYHMRLLARYGFVEDAGAAGDRRERPWKARGWAFDVREQTAAVTAAADVLLSHLIEQGNRLESAFVRNRHALPPEWDDATHIANKRFTLTPAQARELGRRIDELCDEYRDAEGGEGAEDVAVLVRLIPQRVEPS